MSKIGKILDKKVGIYNRDINKINHLLEGMGLKGKLIAENIVKRDLNMNLYRKYILYLVTSSVNKEIGTVIGLPYNRQYNSNIFRCYLKVDFVNTYINYGSINYNLYMYLDISLKEEIIGNGIILRLGHVCRDITKNAIYLYMGGEG